MKQESEAELIARVGPIEIRGHRRRTDDPLVVAAKQLNEAWQELLNEAKAKIHPVLDRFVRRKE